jgi:acyl-CoA dehydrogenase
MSVALDREQALVQSVRTIAREVAAAHADDVDRAGRFPIETIEALRGERALSAAVPVDLGGQGASLETIAQCCLELGRCCGASAMVFAMHQIMVFSIVRHLDRDSWFAPYLSEVAADQRLIASVTSEIGTGGDMGRSIAALQAGEDGALRFEKKAPTVSYGEHADDFLTTLRRGPDAEPGDQVLALTRREGTSLERTGSWDVLGMRGTCSPGFVVTAALPAEQVMWGSFAAVATESMVPISHILWSHLWLGIAEDAFDRARAFVRAAAKRNPGQTPAPAGRLSRLSSELTMLRAEVSGALGEFVACSEGDDRERLSTLAMVLRFNNLKLSASEHAATLCRGALEVCGIMGFKNDTPFSVGRHLRDTMSAALMIANERIHETDARLLLVAKDI